MKTNVKDKLIGGGIGQWEQNNKLKLFLKWYDFSTALLLSVNNIILGTNNNNIII